MLVGYMINSNRFSAGDEYYERIAGVPQPRQM
jgi:hypothetical protein